MKVVLLGRCADVTLVLPRRWGAQPDEPALPGDPPTVALPALLHGHNHARQKVTLPSRRAQKALAAQGRGAWGLTQIHIGWAAWRQPSMRFSPASGLWRRWPSP